MESAPCTYILQVRSLQIQNDSYEHGHYACNPCQETVTLALTSDCDALLGLTRKTPTITIIPGTG
jgi:hypothetical protein